MAKFNREKVLRQLEFKRKWRSYSRYVYIAVPCVLCCVLCLYFAYSKFFVSEEQAVIRTTVGDFIYGDVVIGAYIDGEYSSTIPSKNDGYVVDKVSCDNGAVGEWNNDNWGLLTTNLSKRTKCNVYFKKDYLAPIIAQLDTTGKCPIVNDDDSVVITSGESTDGYLCSAPDAYGTSYYYRGNVINNYVYFAGYYWRIVRINGDNSVRVIYDGTIAHSNDDNVSDRQIGTSAFNSNYNDNAYVGYMYGTPGSSTYAETHANINDSTIKTYLDNWFIKNLSSYSYYLEDNIFCNDRSFSSYTDASSENLGYGNNFTYYRWEKGPWNSPDYTAKLMCPQQNDAFTVYDTSKGNGALKMPIGLISMDELALAGGWSWHNTSNYHYLYSGKDWWTLTPRAFNGYGGPVGVAVNNIVDYSGDIVSASDINRERGVRPVLNLKNNILNSGDGTKNNPYKLKF